MLYDLLYSHKTFHEFKDINWSHKNINMTIKYHCHWICFLFDEWPSVKPQQINYIKTQNKG